MLKDVFENQIGRVLISAILGLGLAAVFRKVCKGNNCIVVQGPKISEVNRYFYKIEDNCYKYTPYASPCDADA